MANPEGNQPLTQEQKDDIVRRLEPYLKSGLSVRKSLIEAEIPRSTFYDLMSNDLEFADKINRFRQFVSVLLNNAIVRQLQAIIKKQNDKDELTDKEQGFMQWFALNSNLTKDEFGERKEVGIYDPEVEIQKIARIIDSQQPKKDEHGTDSKK